MKDKKAYIKVDGIHCPYCGAESLEGGFIEVDAGKASQEMVCTECNRSWQDVYQLVQRIPTK